MPGAGFTTNDVIKICCDVANMENLAVQVPTIKTNMIRKLSQDVKRLTVKAKSVCTLNSDGKTKSMCNLNSDGEPNYLDISPMHPPGKSHSSPYIDVTTRRKSFENIHEPREHNIPGLRGRDLVTIAILVDEHGSPIKTYTEKEDIPCEEYEAAKQVYISRVPFPKEDKTPVLPSSDDSNVKTVADVLTEDIDVAKANILKKRVSKSLITLHTTDLSTAQTFIKLDRFAKVRNEIKNELLDFIKKDLQMISVSQFSLWV